MDLGQYNCLGEYCGPHTDSSVFLILICFPDFSQLVQETLMSVYEIIKGQDQPISSEHILPLIHAAYESIKGRLQIFSQIIQHFPQVVQQIKKFKDENPNHMLFSLHEMVSCFTGKNVYVGSSRPTNQLLNYKTQRHYLFMLNFGGNTICHVIGNKIRVDATLRLGHEAFLEGHQGQMIFSSMFMFDRLEISSKPYIGS